MIDCGSSPIIFPIQGPLALCGASSPCERGHYCTNGAKFPCPGGRFGSSSSESSFLCSDSCPAGFFCPMGSSRSVANCEESAARRCSFLAHHGDASNMYDDASCMSVNIELFKSSSNLGTRPFVFIYMGMIPQGGKKHHIRFVSVRIYIYIYSSRPFPPLLLGSWAFGRGYFNLTIVCFGGYHTCHRS